MKYLSLFSGIGGFELGIQQAYDNRYKSITSIEQNRKRGNRNTNVNKAFLHSRPKPPLCIGYSEVDKYAIQIYKKHFNHKNYGDIRKINEKELEDFDLLVGGFPCQSFSIAGKRGGFNDTRGTLFFDIARIIREKQPRLLLLENVKGLLSHDKGATFFTIISTLDELGYDCQWQVLNSKNFGVPQNRERVFIVGHFRGTPRPQVFPIQGTNTATTFSKTIRTGGKGSLSKKHAWDLIKVNKKGEKKKDQKNAATLTGGAHSGGNHSDMDLMMGEATIDEESGEKSKWIRRLTPKECERLQGFPDDWTQGLSDTQRYKCLGNAVTVNVIKTIINKLI